MDIDTNVADICIKSVTCGLFYTIFIFRFLTIDNKQNFKIMSWIPLVHAVGLCLMPLQKIEFFFQLCQALKLPI
jgi:hypothetical protein